MTDKETTSLEHQRKVSKSWCSTRLIDLFSDTNYSSFLSDCAEYSRRHKILDFLITPGKASAKIQDNGSKLNKVEIVICEFDESVWEEVFGSLVTKAYFIAKLLSGELPQEIEGVFSEIGLDLFPATRDKLQIIYNGQPTNNINKHIAAVIYRLAQRLEEDPFCVFLMRGCGREELTTNIRKLRRNLRMPQHFEIPSSLTTTIESKPLTVLSPGELEKFWSFGEEVNELSFTIKADELPAAILKWLDPLPLSGLEDKVDFLLEEAYAQVARRAHAFGLGL